jgi:hypothetical protein
MGSSLHCRATFDGRASVGQVELESDYVLFRGAFRVKLALSSISAVRVSNGVLRLKASSGTLDLVLGDKAVAWADRIRHPKSRADKFGFKAGQRVSVIGIDDEGLVREIEDAGAVATVGRAAKASHVILFGVSTPRDLNRFTTLKAALAEGGALWSVRPKGRDDVSEARVRAAGLAAGLVDVKVVRFSETHTAEKFVARRSTR